MHTKLPRDLFGFGSLVASQKLAAGRPPARFRTCSCDGAWQRLPTWLKLSAPDSGWSRHKPRASWENVAPPEQYQRYTAPGPGLYQGLSRSGHDFNRNQKIGPTCRTFPHGQHRDDLWAEFRADPRGRNTNIVVARVQQRLPGPDNPRRLNRRLRLFDSSGLSGHARNLCDWPHTLGQLLGRDVGNSELGDLGVHLGAIGGRQCGRRFRGVLCNA
jgi:hypothetical protein